MKRAMKVGEQLELVLRRKGRGGPRPGAGRKRKADAIRHDKRPNVSRHKPIHVTLRVCREVGQLRRAKSYRALRGAVATCLGRVGFRIVHVSIQSNHIHLLIEADHKRELANGVRAFMISATRRLNALRARKGAVFIQRYHAVQISSQRQARHALAYVLNNWRRHHEDLTPSLAKASIDPYSTGVLFDGWDVPFDKFDIPERYEPMLVHAPRSWLLTVGWREHPRIGIREVPGPLAVAR
jgi:REP element-mobilizing transposase RayT